MASKKKVAPITLQPKRRGPLPKGKRDKVTLNLFAPRADV
jgi:hypothetical protein